MPLWLVTLAQQSKAACHVSGWANLTTRRLILAKYDGIYLFFNNWIPGDDLSWLSEWVTERRGERG